MYGDNSSNNSDRHGKMFFLQRLHISPINGQILVPFYGRRL